MPTPVKSILFFLKACPPDSPKSSAEDDTAHHQQIPK